MGDTNTPWYKNLSTLGHIFSAVVAITGSVVTIMTNDFNHAPSANLVKLGGLAVSIASALGIYNNHSS